MVAQAGEGFAANAADLAILKRFESIGDNCEFGFFQRDLGLEPLSLLRFTGIQLPSLLRAFYEDFQDAGTPGDATLEAGGENGELMLKIASLNWRGHTFVREGTMDVERVLTEQMGKFRYLRDKLVEDMEDGEKIFVFRRNEPVVDDSIFALHDSLCWYGPNTLLWVVEAEEGHPPGSVGWLRDGLMKGYIDRLQMRRSGPRISMAGWILLCRNAHALWAAQSAQPGGRNMRHALLQELVFGRDGNADPHLRKGWGRPEHGFQWAIGQGSSIVLDRPPPAAEYVLRLLVKPFRPDTLMRQSMEILVNGRLVRTSYGVPDGALLCSFDASLLSDRAQLDLTFRWPNAISPAEAKAGSDQRMLAVEFRKLRLFGRDRVADSPRNA